MISAGIDIGTSKTCVFALDDEKPIFSEVMDTTDVRNNPEIVLKILKDINPETVACAFGYGLPVKRFSELSDFDVLNLTLSFEKSLMGVRKLIDLLRRDDLGEKTFAIPSVVLLPTVPNYRKINRIDMGTSDKLCSTVLAIYQLEKMGIPYDKQDFVLVEAGYGFNSFIAVRGGKIVDGMGGSLGFPSFSSLGALDFELAYLLRDFPKSLLFKGGVKSYLEDIGSPIDFESIPEEVLNWLFEFLLKGIMAMSVSIRGDFFLVLSGVFFNLYYDEFLDFVRSFGLNAKCLRLEGFGLGKKSAEGSGIVANGLSDGVFRDLIEWVEIKKAKGCVLDHITSDFRQHLTLNP
jgi:predicted butyrate kinase (DUF1464 family)